MANKSGKTPMFTPAQVIDALRKSAGLQTAAARHLGCSKATITNYIQRHTEIRAALDDILETSLDIAEAKLHSKIREGNMTAIIFFLKCKGQARGYIERQHVQMSGSVSTSPFAELSDDELAREIEKAKKREAAKVVQLRAVGEDEG